MIFLYSITNNRTGKMYIGQTRHPVTRWQTHQAQASYWNVKKRTYLQNAMNKEGIDSFQFELQGCFETQAEANDAEIVAIACHHSQDPAIGYNIATGGEREGKGPMAEATKRKLSIALKGRAPSPAVMLASREATKRRIEKDPDYMRRMSHARTPATFQKIKAAIQVTGFSEERKRRIANVWANATPEKREVWKKRLAKAALNKPPMTEATRERLSKALTGRKFSDEHRASLRESCKTRPPLSKEARQKQADALRGRPKSDEHKRRMSEGNKAHWAKVRAGELPARPRPPVTDAIRRKISEGLRGKKHSLERNQRLSESLKAKPKEHWKRLNEMSRNMSQATKDKIAKTLSGKKLSEERKQKMRDWWASLPPEDRERYVCRLIDSRPKVVAKPKKIVSPHLGRKRPPETGRKIAEAQTRYWDRVHAGEIPPPSRPAVSEETRRKQSVSARNRRTRMDPTTTPRELPFP